MDLDRKDGVDGVATLRALRCGALAVARHVHRGYRTADSLTPRPNRSGVGPTGGAIEDLAIRYCFYLATCDCIVVMAVEETRTVDGFTVRIHRNTTYTRRSAYQANAEDVLHGTIVDIDQVPSRFDPFAGEPPIGSYWQLVWEEGMPTRICGVADDEIEDAVERVLDTARAWRTRRETLDGRRTRMIAALARAGEAVGASAPGTPEIRTAMAKREQLIALVLREGLVTDEEVCGAAEVAQSTIDRMRDPEQTWADPFLALDDEGFARRIGVKLPTFRGYVSKGLTPEPDATLGNSRGWHLSTVEKWLATRPGRGARTDMAGS